ncbi:MAG: threonine/serine dehydratase [Alphaproteobacteria bacterium]|nr:threonine/serine dehydratase [Alphaproteobacteria bacterium]
MTSSHASDVPPAPAPAPSAAECRAAAGRLAGVAVRTPLLEAPLLNEQVGGRVLVKAEVLQRTGSFKFRGAYNRIGRLSPEARAGGVVAFSSGNHAQGVALAARLLGVPAVIVMPNDAPAVKIANTRRYGAEVVLIERDDELRERVARELTAERGATLVKPFDDPLVIAGQGTVGLEIVAQAEEAGIRPDAVLVPCGGGGLVSGTAIALTEHWPDVAIHAVEPEGFDDTRRSLASGRRERNPRETGSTCDALLSPTPGEVTFAINRRLLAGGLAVSDSEVAHAMAVAFDTLRLVIEPGGAVALAAVLSAKFDARRKTVVVVASGGNVDPALFAEVLQNRR